MSNFKAYVTKNRDASNVLAFTPGAGGFVVGDLVLYDTGTNTVVKCGADPALILGVAEVDSTSSTISPDGKVPIYVLHPDTVVAMSSATDFTEATRGDLAEIDDNSNGKWRVDPGNSANARVIIQDGVAAASSLDGAIYHVQFIAANLQFDAIAS